MNHDPASDPADARLSALYQAHAAPAELPSAAGDARILALAREAVARPAATPVAPGWRSWLNSSWFGPGLAFATIASLSVVVVALMPKEDIAVERAITAAPGTPPPSAPTAAPVTSAASPMQAPAPSAESAAAVPALSESGGPQAAAGQWKAESAAAVPVMPESGAPQVAAAQSKAKLARTNEAARPLPRPGAPAAPATTAAWVSKAITQRVEVAPTSMPEVEQPNPFPGHWPSRAGGRADPAAAAPAAARPTVAAPAPPAAPAAGAAGDAGPAQRVEKPSLLSESTESRMTANQPVAEVRDAVPTYPNEAQSSIPLPYTYTMPRVPARDAASGMAAAAGSLAGRASAPQQLPATRKEAAAERRAGGKPESPAAAASVAATMAAAPAATTMAAAPPLRDPAEWIKAIQKLRIEGKPEQVTKELTEFRRQYPLYPLPEELKQLVK